MWEFLIPTCRTLIKICGSNKTLLLATYNLHPLYHNPIKKRFFFFPHPLNCTISGKDAFGPMMIGFNNLVGMDDLGRAIV